MLWARGLQLKLNSHIQKEEDGLPGWGVRRLSSKMLY